MTGRRVAESQRRQLTEGQFVRALWAEKGGRVWAGTEQGLFFYEKGSWQPFAFDDGDERPQVFALAPERDGTLWAGTDQGPASADVNRAPGAVDDWLQAKPGGLINDYVRALALDGDGGYGRARSRASIGMRGRCGNPSMTRLWWDSASPRPDR